MDHENYLMHANERSPYVKWKDRETDNPYELFDRAVHDKLRYSILSPMKIYIKTELSDDHKTTTVHIYEKRLGGLSYFYEQPDTDVYFGQPDGETFFAVEVLKSFRKFVLSKYFRLPADEEPRRA